MKTAHAQTRLASSNAAVGTSLIADSLYSDANDRQKHAHNIERLAQETHRPVQEIALVYEDILQQLQVNARIKDFLPILVSKNVKQRLKNH